MRHEPKRKAIEHALIAARERAARGDDRPFLVREVRRRRR